MGGAKDTCKDQADPREVTGKIRAFPEKAFLVILVGKEVESSCCSIVD